MNAQTQSAFASLSAMAQYFDGMNPYEFVGSNPVAEVDPSGLIAHHILPTSCGGAQNGPLVELDLVDASRAHAVFREYGLLQNSAVDADVFWGRKEVTTRKLPRGLLTDTDRRNIIERSLIVAGVDTAAKETQDAIDETLRMATKVGEPTKGRRGGGRLLSLARSRDPGTQLGVDPTTKKFSRQRFRDATGGRGGRGFRKSFGGGGAGVAMAGAAVLITLHDNRAAEAYGDLLALSYRVGRNRSGPSLYDEIEALSIITDLNANLGGNTFTVYYGWNYWREQFGAYAGSDQNAWWAR